MTRTAAVTKAERKARRFERAYMVTSRTAHPAYPGQTVYLAFAKADKYAWAADEQLILDTDLCDTCDEAHEGLVDCPHYVDSPRRPMEV